MTATRRVGELTFPPRHFWILQNAFLVQGGILDLTLG